MVKDRLVTGQAEFFFFFFNCIIISSILTFIMCSLVLYVNVSSLREIVNMFSKLKLNKRQTQTLNPSFLLFE